MMRWSVVLVTWFILGLAIVAVLTTAKSHRIVKLLSLGYLMTGVFLLFSPLSITGMQISVMPWGLGRTNLTNIQTTMSLSYFENILLTIPLGLLIARFFPRMSLVGKIGVGLFVGASIEITQHYLSHEIFINRSSDINDVLANGLGIVIGMVFFSLMAYVILHKKQSPVKA
ncbi:VanZ family protein [Levilactobacillus bambusae]|uniref:VanZ-like domain-containing protein n=1 Tax=Levilactobacillus bambusae TaxID=2024736 RepID=A0A2V1N177_9LACO|nr:VanZ family protein [Levilactobacillus bambusae]PWG00832.1 hypothetical protein DCM90_01245 [Levilactobacillus bambusae]